MMNAILDLSESTQRLGRLALRLAANIERFQKGKIHSLPDLTTLRSQLVNLTGLTNGDHEVSFSGEASAVNLVGAALNDVFDNQKNIGDLASQLSKLIADIDAAPMAEDATLTQLRKFCLSLNQEIVRARYNSMLDAEDYPEFDRERRITR
jgi:hypothetical protein